MRQIFKKLWSFFLIAAFLIGSFAPYATTTAEAASSKTIAKALKSKTHKSTVKFSKSSRYLPDLGAFTSYGISLHQRGEMYSGSSVIEESWKLPSDTARAITEEYIKLLQDDRFHLKIVKEYQNDTSLQYTFLYTGSGKVTSHYYKTNTGQQEYHVYLSYYSQSKGDHALYIRYSDELTPVDTMDRLDGTTAKSQAIKGTSARKAIVKTSNGKYQTSDKRLSVKTGYADIIINGKHYSKKVTFSSNMGNSGIYHYDYITASNVWDNNDIQLRFPHNSPKSGDLYSMADLMFYPAAPKLDIRIENSVTYALLHPYCSPNNPFEYATLRIPKWDTDNVTIVYFAAKYTDQEGKKYTIEGLTAAKYEDPMLEAAEVVTLKKGKTKKLTFNNVAFVPNYELYKWTILSGSDKISLSGKTSRTCKVKGKKKGTAVIKITYEYGIDEPDVLTGIDRNVNRKKTKLYRIKIVD